MTYIMSLCLTLSHLHIYKETVYPNFLKKRSILMNAIRDQVYESLLSMSQFPQHFTGAFFVQNFGVKIYKAEM